MKHNFFLIIIILLAISCNKEETNIGTIEISFANNVLNRRVEIFAMENTNYPIHIGNSFGRSFSTSLSFGNYLVGVSSHSETGLYTKVGFQLNKTNKIVKVVYDEYKQGHIK